MPIWINRSYRIVPLTRSVWDRINPAHVPLSMNFDSYSKSDFLDMSIDGWILHSRALSDKPGSTFSDGYSHQAFFALMGSPQPETFSPVMITETKNGLHVSTQLKRRGDENFLEGTFPFDPEDTPIKSWASPEQDSVFVEKILRTGKGGKRLGEPAYQFKHVIELSAGIVFTRGIDEKIQVHLSRKRYPNIDENLFPVKSCVKQEQTDDEVLTYRLPRFETHFSTEELYALQNQIRKYLGEKIDLQEQRLLVNIVWQRREHLLPQNW